MPKIFLGPTKRGVMGAPGLRVAGEQGLRGEHGSRSKRCPLFCGFYLGPRETPGLPGFRARLFHPLVPAGSTRRFPPVPF